MADETKTTPKDIMQQTLDNFPETSIENELNAKALVDNAGSMPDEIVQQLREQLGIKPTVEVSDEKKPDTNSEMEKVISAIELANGKKMDSSVGGSKSNTRKMRLEDFFADTKKSVETVKPPLFATRAKERVIPTVSEEEFVDYVEGLVEEYGEAEIINEEEIGIDQRGVGISRGCLEKIRASYASDKLLWSERNDLLNNETSGWLYLTSVAENGSNANSFVISDFDIEDVGDFGYVEAGNSARNIGYVDFHTHLASDYFLQVDLGDLDSALVQHPFVENGSRQAEERIFAIASFTSDRKEMHIRVYSHRMNEVCRESDGEYTWGLKRFANDVVVDLI